MAVLKANIDDRVMKERVQILLHQVFFGRILVSLKMIKTEDPSVPTAATDGRSIMWNPAYVEPLSSPQIKGLLAHEVMHVVNMHHLRRGMRDPKRWNIACDIAIDGMLTEAGFDVPDNLSFQINATKFNIPNVDQYKGQSAEVIYATLPKDADGGGGHRQDVVDGSSLQQGEAAVAAEVAEIKIAVRQAGLLAAAAAKKKGAVPGWLKEMIEDICAPKVRWQDVLRRFTSAHVPNDYSFARPNRRYVHQNLYLPGITKEGVGELIVYVDSSGSCHSDQPQFLGELQAILNDVNPEKVHVIGCDTEVKSHHEYEAGEPICREVSGFGGSDFRPAFAFVEQKGIQPVCAIVLSDMYIDFPEVPPDYPVLMISTTDTPGPEWGADHVRMTP